MPRTAQNLTGLALAVAIVTCGCDRNDESTGRTQRPPPASQSTRRPLRQSKRLPSVSTPPVSTPPPADPLQLQEETIAALEAGDLDTAFKRIRAAIRITPEDPQTVFLMARVLAERNRFPEAIWMLDEMAKKVPMRVFPC